MTGKEKISQLSSEEALSFYEDEADHVPIFGSLREISLAENIMHVLPESFESIIDVGCGEGYLLHQINERYNKKEIYGLDLTSGRIAATKRNIPSAKLLRGNIYKLPFPNNSFDVVVCSELIEHLTNYKDAIKELLRISKKSVIITVPNEQELVKVMCPKCKTKHYYDGHVNQFSEDKLNNIFRAKNECNITSLRKFHTIYTYNKLTLKLPKFLRLLLDQAAHKLHKKITFLKPNYLLITVEKKQ